MRVVIGTDPTRWKGTLRNKSEQTVTSETDGCRIAPGTQWQNRCGAEQNEVESDFR